MGRTMTRQLFDLAGADPEVRFSPFCWRTKMALRHKGLDFDAVPWRFVEKDRIAPSGQGRVPTLVDGGHWVHDSWEIAGYLDRTYPDTPRLMLDDRDRAAALFHGKWAEFSLHFPIVRLCILDIHAVLDAESQVYFRKSREERFGQPLEEFGAEPGKARALLLSALQPMEQTLKEARFLGGDAAGYGDYAVFGSLMWPYVVLRSEFLDTNTAVGAWFERMLDLFDGYGRSAKTARD